MRNEDYLLALWNNEVNWRKARGSNIFWGWSLQEVWRRPGRRRRLTMRQGIGFSFWTTGIPLSL